MSRFSITLASVIFVGLSSVAEGQLSGSVSYRAGASVAHNSGFIITSDSIAGSDSKQAPFGPPLAAEFDDIAELQGGEISLSVIAVQNLASAAVSIQAGGNLAANTIQTATFEAEAIASWRDTTFILAPGNEGRLEIEANLVLDGGPMRLSGRGATGSIVFSLRNVPGAEDSLLVDPLPEFLWGPNVFGVVDTNSNTNVQPPNVFPVRYTCLTGFACTIGYEMKINAQGTTANSILGTGSLLALATYGDTLKWGGITSVRNANTGELVTNWSITSTSGFDYSRSWDAQIPEPSSTLLLGAGLWSMLICSRNRLRISVYLDRKRRVHSEI